MIVNQQVTTCQHMLLCSQRSKITVTSTAVNIKFDICYNLNNPLNFVNDSGGIMRYQFQTHPKSSNIETGITCISLVPKITEHVLILCVKQKCFSQHNVCHDRNAAR